jgi:hypothetical protein
MLFPKENTLVSARKSTNKVLHPSAILINRLCDSLEYPEMMFTRKLPIPEGFPKEQDGQRSALK